LIAEQPDRQVTVQAMSEIKRGRGYLINRMLSGVLTAVILLLVFVTGIGILGMTSFAVARRRRTIGIRRALGASRTAIVRYFLVENSLVSLLGMLIGLAGAYALNMLLMRTGNITRLDFGFVLLGVAFLWVVGLLATVFPALDGAKVAPAQATRAG
jgi:putative ABC transport system permease protein